MMPDVVVSNYIILFMLRREYFHLIGDGLLLYLVSIRKEHLVRDDFMNFMIMTFTYPSGGELPLAGSGSFLLVWFRYPRRAGSRGK